MQDFQHAWTAALAMIASGDPELMGIVALSLRVSITATLIATAIGAPLGVLLAI
ncbi:MAG: ABC transporter permease, partial [Pseudolabrys sp.]|nr:ABC transporter permease [Pseudolabrys sp.]